MLRNLDYMNLEYSSDKLSCYIVWALNREISYSPGFSSPISLFYCSVMSFRSEGWDCIVSGDLVLASPRSMVLPLLLVLWFFQFSWFYGSSSSPGSMVLPLLLVQWFFQFFWFYGSSSSPGSIVLPVLLVLWFPWFHWFMLFLILLILPILLILLILLILHRFFCFYWLS